MSERHLQKRIDQIKREIVDLGPLRPGTLYTRYSVCGKPTCRCTRKKKPVKHGPYHYLSYTFEGRSYTEFVPTKRLQVVKKQVNNYDRLMRLVKMLVRSSIKQSRLRK